jgi:transcriptional regulator with GAF, ATPase, and Fis domain
MAEGTIIQPEDLSAEIAAAGAQSGIVPFELPPEGINFEEMERALITKAMERADWVIGKAAPILGLSYKTLQYRIDKHGIEKPEKRGR